LIPTKIMIKKVLLFFSLIKTITNDHLSVPIQKYSVNFTTFTGSTQLILDKFIKYMLNGSYCD